MFQHLKKLNWVHYNWAIQFIFFIAIILTLFINWKAGGIRLNGWIFVSAYTLIFAIGSINALCLHDSRIRDVVATSLELALVFIIPLTYYTLGGSMEATSAMSLVFVLLTITVSPLQIGVGVLAVALCYAAFIHYNNFFEQHPVFREALSEISSAHAEAGVVAVTSPENVRYFTVKTPASLQDISAYDSVYGNKDFWFAIYEANRKSLTSPSADVPAGTRLAIPAARGKPYRIRLFTVPREATLRDVSALPEVYGNPKYGKYLYAANKSKIIDTNQTVLGGTRLVVPELPLLSHYKFLLISLIYIAAALVGLCWRILLQELYGLLTIALSASTGQTLLELNILKEKYSRVKEDNRRMRQEIAMHIVEIDYIINQKEVDPGQK